MKLGAIVTVDEPGTPETKACEFHCVHQVYPVTRRNLVVRSVRREPELWESRNRGLPDGATMMDVYTLVDAEGTSWEYQADGLGGGYRTKDGRRAERTGADGRPGGYFGGQANGYILTDTTQQPGMEPAPEWTPDLTPPSRRNCR